MLITLRKIQRNGIFYFLITAINRFGLLYVGKKIIGTLWCNLLNSVQKTNNKKKLRDIIQGTKLPVIIYPPYHKFDLPLYQRPQHLASQLATEYLYLFHEQQSLGATYKLDKIEDNLFLVPSKLYSWCLKERTRNKKILFIYSNPAPHWTIELVNQFIESKQLVIYDFLDELNNEVFINVDEEARTRHQFALSNKKILLLVTASKLLEEVKQYRPCLTNTYLVPNATDVTHFSKPKKPVNELDFLKGKKIIGYFGALASWVDYQLLEKIAQTYPTYHILILGYIYDTQFKKAALSQYDNITILGPIKYEVLPNYAAYFDVSIIPFRVNTTTLATSPIKLFEYMALGKPIISSDLPECRKYKSALIARNHNEFIELIDVVLSFSKDDEYFKIMKREAEENTWRARAKIIIEAINENINAV